MRVTNYDNYLHVWRGKTKKALEGAVYADELRKAIAEGRICKVPVEPGKPVYTAWDLGSSDMTCIVFFQTVGMEVRVIDYYENQFKKVPHYLEVLQSRGYLYGMHYLPHDGGNEVLAGKSIKKQIAEMYPDKVRVLPRTSSVMTDIEQCRLVWDKIWMDKVKCKELEYALSRYAYEQNTKGRWSTKPRHDIHSNGADAFRTMCMSMQEPKKKLDTSQHVHHHNRAGSQGWM
jgi:phage terminase large subunit